MEHEPRDFMLLPQHCPLLPGIVVVFAAIEIKWNRRDDQDSTGSRHDHGSLVRNNPVTFETIHPVPGHQEGQDLLAHIIRNAAQRLGALGPQR